MLPPVACSPALQAARAPTSPKRVLAGSASCGLVIYGLGLSALDAELGQILASGIHQGRLQQILVVNPHYVEVADRLATLDDAGSLRMPIRCYLPHDLHNEWLYSPADALAEAARINHA